MIEVFYRIVCDRADCEEFLISDESEEDLINKAKIAGWQVGGECDDLCPNCS